MPYGRNTYHPRRRLPMRFSNPLDDLFQSRSHVKVLRALSAIPEGLEVSIREVARRAGVSHPTASGVLEAFRQQGVVHVTRTPWADEIRVNARHVLWSHVLPVLRWERGLKDELVTFLADEISAHAPWASGAYLFGSSSRDDMEPGSDIDVAVTCQKERVAETKGVMDAIAERTAERFGNRLSAIVGSRPVETAKRSGQPGSGLWKQIANEGIPLLAIVGV